MKTPSERVIEALRAERPNPLIPDGLLEPPLAVLDLTEGNQALHAVDLADPRAFQAYIEGVNRSLGASLAVGRYDEDRIVYRHSALFSDGEEARSVHLGADLFVASSTPLMAPLDGVVHSLADNASRGDYGPTIILEHVLGGVCFHTLYGHLERSSLDGCGVGDVVKAGELFARIGTHEENGGWPPHVHVQLIADLGSHRGDFPGVAARSDRERMLARCPDPNVILRLPGLPLLLP